MASASYEVVRAVVIGAGSSSSTPRLMCAMNQASISCPTCADAMSTPHSRNHRLNPSFLLQLQPSSASLGTATPETILDATSSSGGINPDAQIVNIMIDCGKTFRESALKVLAPLNVRTIDGLLLTHSHADAVLGLDDLREFSTPMAPTRVYLDAETEGYLRGPFGYLFPKPESPTGQGLWVASIDWLKMYNGKLRQSGQLLHGLTQVLMPAPKVAVARRVPHKQDHSSTPAVTAPTPTTSPTATATAIPPQQVPWPVGTFHVWHGVDTVCNAFVFPLPIMVDSDHHHHHPANTEEETKSRRKWNSTVRCKVLLYMSDISQVTADTIRAIRTSIQSVHMALQTSSHHASDDDEQREGEVDATTSEGDDDGAFLKRYVEVAILDMLMEQPYVSHLNVKGAVEAAVLVGAAHTYFVGMSHSLNFADMPKRIEELGGDPLRMQLAWDGCVVFGGP